MILKFILLVLYIQRFVHGATFRKFTKLSLVPANASGPEALAFDGRGRGPYVSSQDGRILVYEGGDDEFADFATTSPFRTKQRCDGANASAASTCGRPLGIGWSFSTNELYIVDVKFGFLVAPRHGGLATQLATGYNGNTFGFPNALDIDQENRIVYFTDSGAIFQIFNLTKIIQSGDTSGKLYKYDIKTKQLTLLLSGLSGPTGVAVSKDGSPDNIKRTCRGNYWVAEAIIEPTASQTVSAFGVLFDRFGTIQKSVNLTEYYKGNPVSEVQEYFGRLYVGSLFDNFVGESGRI